MGGKLELSRSVPSDRCERDVMTWRRRVPPSRPIMVRGAEAIVDSLRVYLRYEYHLRVYTSFQDRRVWALG